MTDLTVVALTQEDRDLIVRARARLSALSVLIPNPEIEEERSVLWRLANDWESSRALRVRETEDAA